MKIIFAQGNPGTEYAHTRHNVGFIMIDRLVKDWGASFTPKTKFKADIAEIIVKGEKILLVKPTTFYNETGPVARALVDFYKIDPASEFLVLHDELALPLSVVKTRFSGSDAGNNGIKSLNTHLGQHYARIRIGIYSSLRDRMEATDFVLARFPDDEYKMLEKVFPTVEKFVQTFLHGSLEATKVTP